MKSEGPKLIHCRDAGMQVGGEQGGRGRQERGQGKGKEWEKEWIGWG